jgi:hypothetical protein
MRLYSQILSDWLQTGAPYSEMDENQRPRLSIAKELMTWGDALSRILAKIDQMLQSPNITVAQATDVESISDHVGIVIQGIKEAVRTNDYDRLIASVDRLREEIATAEASLDRMLRPESSR